jgi:ParB-like chromosome segregation protein Spo0J
MILLSDIRDNPHRDKKRNPIDTDKVKSLVESIGTTGFWKGIYGRVVGEHVEIAFGHNRVDAARAAGLKSIPVEIEKLTDSDMLMRMTRCIGSGQCSGQGIRRWDRGLRRSGP